MMASNISISTRPNLKISREYRNASARSWTRSLLSVTWVAIALPRLGYSADKRPQYLTNSVNRRLLRLLSKVLELPDNYLWDNIQSHGGPVGDGYFRHALFYPLEGQHKVAKKGVRMFGHTDYGTTTMLFSVPITALQIWKDEKWKFVPYKPGALVINLGENLEVISGGHFKATLHKVSEPPIDQQHEQRLSLVLFNGSKGDMRLKPITGKQAVSVKEEVMLTGI